MSKKKLAVLLASILIGVGLIGTILTYHTVTDPSRIVNVEETFAAETIADVIIQADYADIEIITRQSEEIKVTVRTPSFEPQIAVTGEDAVLRVRLTQSRQKLVQLNPFQKTPVIKVYIPEQHLGSIRIESENGRIQASGLSAEAIYAEADNGLIKLADLVADQLVVETDNGKITLENITGSIHAVTQVGAITLKNDTLLGDVTLTTDIGMIEIQTREQPTNAEISATVEVGTIRIYGKANENTRFGAGENEVRLHTNVGEIKVK